MSKINAKADIANINNELSHLDPQSMLSFDDKRKYFLGLSVEAEKMFKGNFVALVTEAFEKGTKLDATLYKKLAKEALIKIVNVEKDNPGGGSGQVNTSAVKMRNKLKHTGKAESHNPEKPEPSELVKAKKNSKSTGKSEKPALPPKPDYLKKK